MVMEEERRPREQLGVLRFLDEEHTQLYHLIAILISGMGYFTDAYDFFAISLVIDLVGYQHYHGHIPRIIHAAIYGIALCGAVFGQLLFGWLGDKMGRKPIYGVTLILMVITSIASGFSFGSGGSVKNVVVVLCFFRFFLGVSIGGDYPLSATYMSEWANKKDRGALMSVSFAMQGFGNLAAGIVGMVVAACFKRSAPHNADFVWRIVLMLGAVPAIPTYYWRMTMPETARHTALVAMDARRAASDMSAVLNVDIVTSPEDDRAVTELARLHNYGLFSVEFLRRHGSHLLSTSVCWLVLDVTFFSLLLFMTDIFTELRVLPALPRDGSSPFRRTFKIAEAYTVISLCGTLPGYFFTAVFVDRIGRIRMQQIGFAMLIACTLCLAALYGDEYWSKHKAGFEVVYGITTFFANFANTTTIIVPAEIFPARLRSTCHGISGAFGKVGAIIGVLGFLLAENQKRNMLFGLAGCNFVGLVFTRLLPESKRMSLEEITGEMERQKPEQDAGAVAAAEEVELVSV